jgi:hypothetical protein
LEYPDALACTYFTSSTRMHKNLLSQVFNKKKYPTYLPAVPVYRDPNMQSIVSAEMCMHVSGLTIECILILMTPFLLDDSCILFCKKICHLFQ